MNVLETSDLLVTFSGPRRSLRGRRTVVRAVRNVSLDVRPQETLALVGESGSGKSTVARCVLGLVRPQGGTISFEGNELGPVDKRSAESQRGIQMVFQDPGSSLNPRMTIGSIIGEAWRTHPAVAPDGDRGAALRRALADVGLDAGVAARRPSELSGGQQQRVSIARALALRPRLLVCDEAVSALDVSVQSQILRLLVDLRRTHELSVLFPATLVEFLALEEPGMAALSRLAAHVGRFVTRSDTTLLPRAGFAVADVELLAPVPRPRLYWGLVTNAPSFVRNNPGTRIVNLFPLGHQRPQGTVVGPGAAVIFKDGHHLPLMAYNVELAVVIGKAGRYIPLDRAMDHVAGYAVVDDVSGTYYYGIVPGNAGRGYSLPDGYGDWLYQATASWGGKKADTMAPMGPYLVTKDEVVNPYDLLMYTRQSGRLRDRAHSGAALLGIERVIAWYSSFASLYPGDVIHFATMGVDGLPVYPDEPAVSLEVEIEDVGTLANPVVVDGPVPMAEHPSYAVREAATSAPLSIQDWSTGSTRHFHTAFGNHVAAAAEGLPRLAVPRFLNGPASSLGVSGLVEIPPRATDLVVSVELAVVVRALGEALVLGYLPMVSLCDRSFADAVVEPARAGERGIAAMYGRWADGFNVIGELTPLPADDWRDRDMTLRIGDRLVVCSTSDYVAGPGELIGTISAMITLFPGDVITLGSTTARLDLTREEYDAGVVVRGGIAGLGVVTVELQGAR